MGQSFTLESHRPTGGADAGEAIFVENLMTELDGMRAQVSEFHRQDPADVMLGISGIAGRLGEIRVQLLRRNSQRCTVLRTREVDPLREDLDLQFKVHSRRVALMEWELKMTGGAV